MSFFDPIIRSYLALAGNPIFLIFTGISVWQLVRGVSWLRQLWPGWEKFSQNPLTNRKLRWGDRAAFTLVVPLGVLLHELGHAVVVWLNGGRVVEFGFFFYWGYVLPDRVFDPITEWILASAGTWANLLLAAAIWGLLAAAPSEAWRFFGLRSLRFQIFFAMIYYPIFTLLLQIGDWRTIYDFGSTPLLSGITAVAHVAILGGHWWLDRQGYYEMPSHDSEDEVAEYEELQAALRQNPSDVAAQTQLALLMANSGAVQSAKRIGRQLARQEPNNGNVLFLKTWLEIGGRGEYRGRQISALQKALELGISVPLHRVVAHQILANYYLKREKYDQALQQLDDAKATISTEVDPSTAATTFQLRGLALRHKKQYIDARLAVEEALRLAELAGNKPQIERARQELDLIDRRLNA